MKNISFKNHKCITLLVRSFLLVLILFLCINFSACTLSSNIKSFFKEKFSVEAEMNEVVEIVDVFFDLLIDKDYEGAYWYISSRDKSQKNLEGFKDEFKDVTDIVSININWVEIKNNIAVVGMDLTDFYDGEEKVFKDIEVSLIKEEDGDWQIVFWNL
ncbi:MAG: hypothetical protein ISS14_04390 [Actinobacteria bacterium]|nr:hypothetical protein [Actinomycetota bacterium]